MSEWTSSILTFMNKSPKRYVESVKIERYLRETFKGSYDDLGGYFLFAKLMKNLEIQGEITPVKSKGDNHQHPPIYNTYKLTKKEAPKNPAHIKKMMSKYPLFNMTDFFVEKEYLKWKFHIDQIHSFIQNGSDTKSVTLKANERSFELFRDEKFLLSKDGFKLLSKLGVNLDDLNCRRTYEPFIEYHLTNHPKNLFIIENKDTFDSVKELMLSGDRTWFGVSFDMVIYGEGDKIQRSYEFLNEYNLEDYHVYYFGDLDARGIWICSELMKMDTKVRPFVPFYLELIQRYGSQLSTRKIEKPLKETHVLESMDRFLSFFPASEHKRLRGSVEIVGCTQTYLPQEGLNAAILKHLAEGGKG